ncbi:MAG: hypothetical protein WC915_03340 [archaeon]|jgi:hypothetical protein
MPKPNFASKLREVRRKRFDALINARTINKARQESLTREFKKSPITYGKDGEMHTHAGLPTDKIVKAQEANANKEKAAAKFRKARDVDRNSKILDGVEIGKKATFVSLSGKTYSGKVIDVNPERGTISLQTGFFRITTKSYKLDLLKAKVK